MKGAALSRLFEELGAALLAGSVLATPPAWVGGIWLLGLFGVTGWLAILLSGVVALARVVGAVYVCVRDSTGRIGSGPGSADGYRRRNLGAAARHSPR